MKTFNWFVVIRDDDSSVQRVVSAHETEGNAYANTGQFGTVLHVSEMTLREKHLASFVLKRIIRERGQAEILLVAILFVAAVLVAFWYTQTHTILQCAPMCKFF